MPPPHTAKLSSALELTLVDTVPSFMALEDEWNALLQTSTADGIFLTWEYISTWWEVYGQQSQPCIIVARNEVGQLIGIAPFAINSGCGIRRFLRQLSFLGGDCESLAERQDFIVAPEQQFGRACWALLQQHPGWDVLRLDCARNSSTLHAFTFAADQAGHTISEQQHPTWVAQLPDSWDGFLATRSSKFREMTRKKLRKLHSAHTIHFRTVDAASSELPGAMDLLIKLNHERWKDANRSFHTPKFLEFHRLLAPRLAQRGWVSLNLLEIDGRVIAARYDFRYQERLWGFQSGWSDSHSEHSVGHVTLAYTVQHAIAQGLTAFDFQAGASQYKNQWAEQGEPVIELEIINPRRLRAHCYSLMKQFLTTLADERNV
jgi:CelD/BcsL family acetyltransferase involved in cellulose biosynthesis